MEIKIPQIAVPRFWLASFGMVQKYLNQKLSKGKLHEVGASSLGYPIRAVEYPREGCVKLMVVGGTHGHEPGGVATVMNLIHLLESGRDLADKPHGHGPFVYPLGKPVRVDLFEDNAPFLDGEFLVKKARGLFKNQRVMIKNQASEIEVFRAQKPVPSDGPERAGPYRGVRIFQKLP